MKENLCFVKELEENEYQKWDELVESSSHGTIFHTSDWLMTCSRLLGIDLHIYGCFKEERLVGGCSFYSHKRRSGLRMAFSALSNSPYGGVVMTDIQSTSVRDQEQHRKGIINALINKFEKESFCQIELTFSPEYLDIRPFTWNNWKSTVLYAYYVILPNFEKRICGNRKNDIRKALKSNILVNKSEDIGAFYQLFVETFRHQGLKPPVEKKIIEEIYETLSKKQRVDMWFSKTEKGELASAAISIYDKKRAYEWCSASDSVLRKTGAHSLLLYTLFSDLQKRGFKEMNVMSGNIPQLTKFVTDFNPSLRPFYRVEKVGKKYRLLRTTLNTLKNMQPLKV